MTELLEQAVEKLRNLPPEAQDSVARMVLNAMKEDEPALVLSAEEEASFDQSLEEEKRGAFASEEAIRAIWTKYGL